MINGQNFQVSWHAHIPVGEIHREDVLLALQDNEVVVGEVIVSSCRIMHFMQNARASRSINQETSLTGSLTSQRQPSLLCAQSHRILNGLDLMIDEFV